MVKLGVELPILTCITNNILVYMNIHVYIKYQIAVS